MSSAVAFYFDFSSPYGYLASERVDQVFSAVGRTVAWKPMLLGAVFPETGARPLLDIPYKGDYAKVDIPRSARRLGLTFRLPKPFPFPAVAASRLFYWCHDQDETRAKAVAQAIYRRAFSDGLAPVKADEVADLAVPHGFDKEAALAALGDADLKARLREEVDAAKAAGVFGSPFLIVDEAPFWGHDRLDEAAEWARTGGW